MKYYAFGKHLARQKNIHSNYEWYEKSEWVKNKDRSLYLHDAMNDYGDWSWSDYDEVTEAQAEDFIKRSKK